MKKQCLNLTAHQLTQDQLQELYTRWQIKQVIDLPHDLKSFITQVSETSDMDLLISKIINFCTINLRPKDLIFVQGQHDFTVECVIALSETYIPIFAFSKRQSCEQPRGNQVVKQSVFEHICFKPYTYYIKKWGNHD